MTYKDEPLYGLAKLLTLEAGLPYTDPRDGKTYLPERRNKRMVKHHGKPAPPRKPQPKKPPSL